jgi:hypothetical protein
MRRERGTEAPRPCRRRVSRLACEASRCRFRFLMDRRRRFKRATSRRASRRCIPSMRMSISAEWITAPALIGPHRAGRMHANPAKVSSSERAKWQACQ